MLKPMLKPMLLVVLVVVNILVCQADSDIAEPKDDTGVVGSWFYDRFTNISQRINDLMLTEDPQEKEGQETSANVSRKAPFWSHSGWNLWNSTNGLLKKAAEIDETHAVSQDEASSKIAGQKERFNIGESIWHYLGKVPRLKGPWGRDSTNATVGSDYVVDQSVAKTVDSDSHVVGDRDGDGIVDVVPPVDGGGDRLLPSEDLLEALKCRPAISFGSCFQHCLTLVAPLASKQGYSLTQNLMDPEAASVTPRSLLTEVPRKLKSEELHDTNATSPTNEGDKGASSKFLPEDETTPKGFDLWEVAQVRNCVVSVCTEDYIKKPLPGCLDGSGNLVQLTPERVPPPVSGKPSGVAQDYRNLDFYDPGRLEFWNGMGFFTLQRIWFDIVHGRGLVKLVVLPCIVMVFLSLPMFLLALIVPGMTVLASGEGPPQDPRPPASRPAMALHAMDIDDFGGALNASGIRLCDATLANSRALSYLKFMVDGLSAVSAQLATLLNVAVLRGSACINGDAVFFETSVPSNPGLVEMVDRSHMKYSPIPSSELIPAEEEVERGKRWLPGTGTTLPSTGKTLPSPTHGDRQYFDRFH